MAARLAAERIKPEEIEHLRQVLEEDAARLERAPGNVYPLYSADIDFHAAIIHAAHSDQLKDVLFERVFYQLGIQRLKSSARRGRSRAALDEHYEIVSALEAHDPDRAEQVMRRHIRNARLGALVDAATS